VRTDAARTTEQESRCELAATAEQLARLLVARRNAAALAQPSTIDWPAVTRLARAEGVAGMVLDLLETHDIQADEGSLRALKHERYQGLAANTLMRDEAAALLFALEAKGIPALLLKGVALQETLYPSLDLRRMGDIDLLVHPEDAVAALKILQRLGYHRSSPELWPGSDLKFENEAVLQRDTPARVLVELHWQLIDGPHYQARIDESFFWSDASVVDVAGAKGLSMRPEALLLYLCTHLELHHARHEAPHLRWIHDLWALIDQQGDTLDWIEVEDRASAFGLRLPLARALERVADAPWQAKVPEALRQRLRAHPPTSAEQRAYERSLRQDLPATRLWHDLSGMPGWGRRLRFLVYNLFPSPSYMRVRYPQQRASRLWILYLRRWKRGLKQLVPSRAA
jgi:hypothetical protein